MAAHLRFWQQRQIAWTRGEDPPKVDNLDATFAPPPLGAWEQLVWDVLAGIDQVKQSARAQAVQPSSFYDNASVGYGLASAALHNGYHLGQVVLLRQMQRFWPPAGDGGDW